MRKLNMRLCLILSEVHCGDLITKHIHHRKLLYVTLTPVFPPHHNQLQLYWSYGNYHLYLIFDKDFIAEAEEIVRMFVSN